MREAPSPTPSASSDTGRRPRPARPCTTRSASRTCTAARPTGGRSSIVTATTCPPTPRVRASDEPARIATVPALAELTALDRHVRGTVGRSAAGSVRGLVPSSCEAATTKTLRGGVHPMSPMSFSARTRPTDHVPARGAKAAARGVDHELDGTPDVRAGRADWCHPLLSRRTERGDVRPGFHQLLGHLLRRTGGAAGPRTGAGGGRALLQLRSRRGGPPHPEGVAHHHTRS